MSCSILGSHPSRVRGLKYRLARTTRFLHSVAPFTGAWIEISGKAYTMDDLKGVAPFTGAWIEIITAVLNPELTFCRTLHGCVD